MILGNSLFQTEVLFNTTDSVPTYLVKLDTTADGSHKVVHQLPHWSGDTFVPYGWSWAQYKTQQHIASKEDTHCFLVHESNDPNVPVGTKWGACPEDPADNDDDNGDEIELDLPDPSPPSQFGWVKWAIPLGLLGVVGIVVIKGRNDE